jgi:hypothetical protein
MVVFQKQAALRAPQSSETRIQGVLTALDCNAKGTTFQVRSGGKVFKFHPDNFERMKITAFTTEVSGEITCGPRKPKTR